MAREDISLYRTFLIISERDFDEKLGVADKFILKQIVRDSEESLREYEPRISPRFLPSYMILGVISTMTEFGYTPNKKIRDLLERIKKIGSRKR